MKIQVKNPIFLILLNWIILLIGYFGIPLIPSMDANTIQQYILSFLSMNFHFFGEQTKIAVLIVSWVIAISLYGVIAKPDWKIPLYCMFSELFVYLFAIILMKKNFPLEFDVLKIELLKGFGIICGIISLLYGPILIRYLISKRIQKTKVVNDKPKFISKCPHCGTEYQSNPIFCYTCSKRIISL